MNTIQRWGHNDATGDFIKKPDGEYVLYADYHEAYGAYFKCLQEMDAKVQALEAEAQKLREALKDLWHMYQIARGNADMADLMVQPEALQELRTALAGTAAQKGGGQV